MAKIARREMLRWMARGGAALVASPLLAAFLRQEGMARADGPAEKGAISNWARLKFTCVNGDDDDWNVHPHGDLNLIQKINGSTTVNLGEQWNVAAITKVEEMTRFPLLFMHADNEPQFTEAERDNLREYLLRGGFLYAEDCVNGKYHHQQGSGQWDFFFRKMSTYLRELIPGADFRKLPLDHAIFHCYFDLRSGQPHMQGVEHGGWGLVHKKRLLAYLSPSDCHCAWASASWFGEERTREAVKMGTNVYLYAMTH